MRMKPAVYRENGSSVCCRLLCLGTFAGGSADTLTQQRSRTGLLFWESGWTGSRAPRDRWFIYSILHILQVDIYKQWVGTWHTGREDQPVINMETPTIVSFSFGGISQLQVIWLVIKEWIFCSGEWRKPRKQKYVTIINYFSEFISSKQFVQTLQNKKKHNSYNTV